MIGVAHLERLGRARELLAARGLDTAHCGLVFFSAAGFSESLRTAAERGGVLLVGLDEIYGRAMPTGFVP